MPPKRPNPTEHHPPSSSSEEEEENSSVVAESSSEEEKEQEPCLSKTLNLSPNSQSSNTENESESDAESESEAEEEPSPVALTPVKSSSKKSGGSDWKSGKKNGAVEKSENVKKVSQQFWSKEDEIALLEGIIEYKAKRRIDPPADFRAFRDFIKGRLHFDVELVKLKRKISRYKVKLLRNHFKNDEGMAFSNSHHQLVYDLSKRIWRVWLSKKTAARSKNNNGGDKMDFEMERQPGAKKRVKFDKSFYGVANMEEFVMKMGLELLDDKKKTEMEEKWKKLKLEELKLFARKQELLKEESDMIMAVLED